MAYTVPTEMTTNMESGVSKLLTTQITGTGAKAPFAVPKSSGIFWGQATFQCLLGSVTTITADLEVDLTNTDANFEVYVSGLNLFSNPIQVLNLSGGNARYRWNIKTFVDGGATGAYIYGIVG